MEYLLRFAKSRRIGTVNKRLKREEIKIKMTYTYIWPKRSH